MGAATLFCRTSAHVSLQKLVTPTGACRFRMARLCLSVKGLLVRDCVGHLLVAGTGDAGLRLVLVCALQACLKDRQLQAA